MRIRFTRHEARHTAPSAAQKAAQTAGFRSLGAALAVALGSAQAETAAPTPDEVRKDLISVQSSASIGLGSVSADNRRFGQHTGLNKSGRVLLLDLDLIQRDEGSGTWLKLRGRNLGLDSRELRFTLERQGDWAYSLFGTQGTRHEPLIVNSGLQGVGTGNQIVSASTTKRDLDLKVEHNIIGLGARKFVAAGLDVELSFKQDDSKGARMFGRGASNIMEFLTEPVDRSTRQWGLTAGYANRDWQLSGGYSGSSYSNHVPVLNATGGNSTASGFGAAWVMAMAPSNAAHQLHLSGGYNWGAGARSSFKVSRTLATQDQAFDPVFTRLAAAPASLNGRVVTTLAFADLTLRALQRLDLKGSLRLEDRDDRTPVARYLNEALPTVGGSFSTAGVSGFNKPRSLRQVKGTVEASVQLDEGYRLSGALEQETLNRGLVDKYRRVGFRERENETTVRLDFKRGMSEVLNAGVALLHSERRGSEYIPDTYDPNALTNQVNALMFADRSRDKLRFTADWTPAEAWSVMVLAEQSQDSYSGRAMGPRTGKARFVSIDASWRPNERWTVTAWASNDHTYSQQITRSDRVGAAALGYNTLWQADLRYTTQAAGLSLQAKPRATTALAVDFSASDHSADTGMASIGGTGTLPVNPLPRYVYRQKTLKLSAEKELNRESALRMEMMVDQRRNNDWTWTNWTYNGAPAVAAAARTSDGTTVNNRPSESIVFTGVSYRLRWR